MTSCHASGQAPSNGQMQPDRCTERAYREAQGKYSGQGRASVSGDQALVWFREDARSWTGQEHGADQDIVCAKQSVDGASADSAGHSGVSESAARPMAQRGREMPVLNATWTQKEHKCTSHFISP
jgi:hypothetical protein